MKLLLLQWLLACGPKKDLPVLEGYDISRASLSEKNEFPPFQVSSQLPLLKDSELGAEEKLLVYQTGEDWIVFSVRQMSYHHVAQGEWKGKPYLVVF